MTKRAQAKQNTAPRATWKGRKRQNPIKRRPPRTMWSDKQRDPEMLFLIERTEADHRSVAEIAFASYLWPGTLVRAIDGETVKPHNSTLTLWAKGLGLRRAFVDESGKPHFVPDWDYRINAMKDKLKEREKK